ncbi:carboxymuconolactone decarboxylase family protein [Pseudoalteromonas luteoviolacea]|uniref:carboxymuconolactone decarboxylase family protein n=1 Tax=Pseudoalteromonas luteoviolacea TaxID=43657 RepID=UPI001F1D4F4E|nr:carboxymuconolactone decarboxylase family protein [Pseudoalteromonas luteoviolacea]MCF6441609.1 carboxymuconolactone decarboxylase family protein [Pseudoalteromonas luteoviolacea]
MISQSELFTHYSFIPSALATLGESGEQMLPDTTVHLLRLYVSQINGCQYCQIMHTDALQNSVPAEQFDLLLSALSSSDLSLLSAFDQAVLQLANAVTKSLPCDLAAKSQQPLTQAQQLAVVGLALQINSWNRVAIGFNF